MKEIVDMLSLGGDKSMSEMHSRQPVFTYSACEPFNRNKDRIKKGKGDSRYINENELDKSCFQHDITYGDFKNLPRRTATDKVLRDKAFSVAEIPKCDRHRRRIPAMVCNFFDERTSGGDVKDEMMSN